MPAQRSTARARKEKSVVGWREWVTLPALGDVAIKAKVDTGARTSCLHASDLEEFERDGTRYVRFVIHPDQRRSDPRHSVTLPLLTRRRVKNSGGKTEVRPVVKTEIELNGRRWSIELTLTRRGSMGFRMLLGREAMRNHMIVDPGRSFLAGRRRPQETPPDPCEIP